MASPDMVAHVTTGEPRTGGWCARCGLPSLIEVDVTATSETAAGAPLGVSTSTATYCTNHEES